MMAMSRTSDSPDRQPRSQNDSDNTTVTSAIPVLSIVCRTGKPGPGAEKIAMAAISEMPSVMTMSRTGFSSPLKSKRRSVLTVPEVLLRRYLQVSWWNADCRNRFVQLPHVGRLAEHLVDRGGQRFDGRHALTPPSQHEHHRRRTRVFHGDGHASTVDVRHAEIGDDHGIWLAKADRQEKSVDSGLAAVGAGDLVSVVFQGVAQRAEQDRVVVDHENPVPAGFCLHLPRHLGRTVPLRGVEAQPYHGALAG